MKRSIYCYDYSQVNVSDYMSGKMEGIPSISTSCRINPYCISRMNKSIEDDEHKCICTACFAADGLAYKKGLSKNSEENFKLLNASVLTRDELPQFIPELSDIVRIESFGDVASVTQALNYLNIIYMNPDITFGLWTKNPQFYDNAINEIGKPDNVVMVLSSEYENEVTDLYKKYSWVDKVFTVYTLNYLLENKMDVDTFINCGGKRCKCCRTCYDTSDETFFINELEKKDQKRWQKMKEEHNE